MALSNLRETKGGRSYSFDEKRNPVWTKRYEAEFDPDDDPDAWALPYAVGDPWTPGLTVADGTAKPAIRCKSVRAQESADDGGTVLIECTFGYTEATVDFFAQAVVEAPDPGTGALYPSANPLDWRPDISYGFTRVRKTAQAAFKYDEEGEYQGLVPLVNSAGDTYPDLERDYLYQTITITRLESYNSGDIAMWRGAIDTTNDDEVAIDGITYPARALYMDDIKFSRTYLASSSAWVWSVSYTILIDTTRLHETWVLDQGFYRVDGGMAGKVSIDDANGDPVTVPALLNGAGIPLADDEEADGPVYLHFELCGRSDWSALSLPSAA
jgi:hypothetical protein